LEIPDIRFLKFRFRFDGIKSPEGRNIGSPVQSTGIIKIQPKYRRIHKNRAKAKTTMRRKRETGFDKMISDWRYQICDIRSFVFVLEARIKAVGNKLISDWRYQICDF